jgi:glycine C-acetyltransferase
VINELSDLKERNLFRSPPVVEAIGSRAIVNGEEKINFCSNDYLGLSSSRRVVAGTIQSLRTISQCSSRLVAGNSPILLELEETVARHRKTEAGLLYPNGYMANLGLISTLSRNGATIFSDELNHASIIDACRLSRTDVKVFAHNDEEQLEKLLLSTRGDKIVITEGVFSMDGDLSKLDKICCISKNYDATLIVDDAHGDFVFGMPGSYAGIPEHFHVNERIDMSVSSLSKGLGCFGGYVACSNPIRELLINKSRQLIYTSALPEHLCVASLIAIPLAVKGHLQKRLFRNIRLVAKGLAGLGFSIGKSASQIIPVMIGDEKKAVNFASELTNNGIFVQAIRYPTVSKGNARIRLSITSDHTYTDIQVALNCFEYVGKRNGII